MGQLPSRVFMAIADNDACTGSITKNPFNFKHFNTSQVGVYLNGEMSGLPLKLNFTDNQCVDGCRSLFTTAGRIDMDNVLDIRRVDYKSGYLFLYLIHLSFFVMGSLKNGKEMELCERI